MGDVSGSNGDSRSHIHLCQVFDGQDEFRAAAVRFLADGLSRGNRVRYVAEGDDDALRADLAPLFALPQARRDGAVEVVPVAGTYNDPAATVAADTQVEVYAAATRAALADGFTGLRVAADVTSLVRTSAQLDTFARYEHRADRYMTGSPFSAMCGYRRTELGDDAVAQVACLHPGGSGEDAPFRLHAAHGAGLVLSGELDLTTVDLFAGALDRTGPDHATDATSEVVVDATGLDFTDHRNLLVLERTARRHDRSVVLRTGRRWPGRLVETLELTRVRVERVV